MKKHFLFLLFLTTFCHAQSNQISTQTSENITQKEQSMKQKKYKNIIFDLGGVVLTNDWFPHDQEFLGKLSDYYQTTPKKLNEGWNKGWKDFYPGKITENEFWKILFKTSNAQRTDPEFAMKAYRERTRENENMLNLLERLKKQYTLSALTTISKEWLDFKREKFELDQYFEVIVSSGYTGWAKPDQEIYDILVSFQMLNPKSLYSQSICCEFIYIYI